MEEGKWCYSFNGENFEGDFETKERAIEEAIFYYKDDERDEDFIWVGQTKSVSTSVNVDGILEYLAEEAYDQAGEYAEGYLDNVTVGDQRMLESRMNEVLMSWMNEFKYEPRFFTVINSEKLDIRNYV